MNNTIYIFAWGNNPKRAELKGRPCKILAQGALNSCEAIFVDTGQCEIVKHQALHTIKCQWCQRPVIEIDLNTEYCVRLCDNHKCPLYAQQQGYRERSEEESGAYINRRKATVFVGAIGKGRKEVTPEIAIQNERHRARRSYGPWLERKKRNYRKLRDLRYSPEEAARNSSTKRMRELGINV